MKEKLKVGLVGTGMLVPALPVVASEGAGTANQAVVGALTTTANDMVATGTSLIPVALTVVGLSMAVIFGIRLFKRISNK